MLLQQRELVVQFYFLFLPLLLLLPLCGVHVLVQHGDGGSDDSVQQEGQGKLGGSKDFCGTGGIVPGIVA